MLSPPLPGIVEQYLCCIQNIGEQTVDADDTLHNEVTSTSTSTQTLLGLSQREVGPNHELLLHHA